MIKNPDQRNGLHVCSALELSLLLDNASEEQLRQHQRHLESVSDSTKLMLHDGSRRDIDYLAMFDELERNFVRVLAHSAIRAVNIYAELLETSTAIPQLKKDVSIRTFESTNGSPIRFFNAKSVVGDMVIGDVDVEIKKRLHFAAIGPDGDKPRQIDIAHLIGQDQRDPRDQRYILVAPTMTSLYAVKRNRVSQ